MSSYSINIDHYIAKQDSSKLLGMLGIVDKDDELLINIPSGQAQLVIDILNENSFNVTTKGDYQDAKYKITAKRR